MHTHHTCVTLQVAGVAVAKALKSRNYYLKAFFLTLSPSRSDFVESVGRDASEHVLTAAFWHPEIRGLADSFFGKSCQYSEDFERTLGYVPNYLSAIASATTYSLILAIQHAFESCTFVNPNMDADSLLFDANAIECVDSTGASYTDKPIGYDLVLSSLATQSLNTFFGRVDFNQFRRNIGHKAVVLQVVLARDAPSLHFLNAQTFQALWF